MDPDLKQWILAFAPSVLPTLAVLIAMIQNNKRIDDLGAGVNKRIDDLRTDMHRGFDGLKDLWRSELHRVEEVIDARLKHLEER